MSVEILIVRRVDKLKKDRDSAERQACCLEFHVDFASKALELMQRLVDSGSDWKEIANVVKEVRKSLNNRIDPNHDIQQRRLNHPIASFIKSVDLAKNKTSIVAIV